MPLAMYLTVPFWLLCWLAFYGLPVSLVVLPFVENSPWPYFLVLYVVMAVFGGSTLSARILELDSDPNAPALNLIHPHGIVCHGVHAVMISRTRQDVRPVLLTSVWPLVYVLLIQYGWTSASASARSIEGLMRARRDMWLYPGGFREAALHYHKRDVVDVGSRGAIRLALRFGYPVRVAFVFGERKTAYNLQGFWKPRMWLAKRGIPAVVPFLRVFCKTPVRVVVSRTLALPQLASPTEEDVERWHSKYVATLKALHVRFKSPDDPSLVVQDLCRANGPPPQIESASDEPRRAQSS
jgi:hypothetical protein